MAIGINEIIILATLFVIYGVFLLFDLFKRNEKWGYFAYIMAVIPVNYIWFLGIDILIVYTVLFALFLLNMIRDLIGISSDDKDFDDVVLFLLLGIVIQLIITAILPDQVPEMLQNGKVVPVWYFNLPGIFDAAGVVQPWVDSTLLLAFRLTASGMIFFAIIPLIVSIKGEEFPFIGLVIVVALFIGPFVYLAYIWLPGSVAVLTFLFSVVLFILLLIITKSGK